MKNKTSKWIVSFLEKKTENLLIEVPIEYIKDRFNLHGLDLVIKNISHLLEIILSESLYTNTLYHKNAGHLYIYIHQRYILTPNGLKEMNKRIKNSYYGKCQIKGCRKNKLIPIGLSDKIGDHKTQLYCYKCNGINSTNHIIDGASFGVNFCEFLRLVYKMKSIRKNDNFIPKLFGFEVLHIKPRLKTYK